MTKEILSPGPKKFKTTCTKCKTEFSYELEDVHTNYRGFPNPYVSCPSCSEMLGHYGHSARHALDSNDFSSRGILRDMETRQNWDISQLHRKPVKS